MTDITPKGKKATSIRLDIDNYNYIKSTGVMNNRSISGQANWMCQVHYQLKEFHPDIYAQICNELDGKFKNRG